MMKRVSSKKAWQRGCLGLVAVCLALTLVFGPGTAQQPAPRLWEKLGPNRIAVWSFSPNFATDNTVFIATSALEKLSLRGVYRSEDRGATWKQVSEGLTAKKRDYYTALKLSPTYASDSTLWLTGHKTSLAVKEAFGGLWESTDDAATWSEIDYKGFPLRQLTGKVSQDLIGLVISPKIAEDGLMVGAAAGEGVYASHDKGRNWEVLSPIKDITNIFAPPNFPDEPFLALATTGSQVMVSTDGGKTFETRGSGLSETMKSVRGVAFSANFAQDRTMFCFGAAGVYMSKDAGMNWALIAEPEQNASIESLTVAGDFSTFGAIADGTDDSKIFLSEDMGKTFASIGAETVLSYKVDTLAFPPDYADSRQIFAGSQDGIFRYGPAINEEAAAAAQSHADSVEATRVARATTVAGMEFVPEQSDRVETGCIAYSVAPLSLIVVLAVKTGRSDKNHLRRNGLTRNIRKRLP